MKKEPETRQYRTFTDDFIEAKDQDYAIPEGYKWVRTSLGARIASALLYGAAAVFSSVYCRLCLHMHIENAQVLRQARQSGAFIYANHTQPLGDVFIPALAALPRRVYVVVSPANLSIPVIGRLLPYLGALPLPDSMQGMRAFHAAMEQRLAEKKYIVIYPEAHVWEYYTGIRPFPDAAFRYPVKLDKPVYAVTVTYQKRCLCRKPKMVVYVDGPFYPDKALPPRDAAKALHDTVYTTMQARSRKSNCAYIRYEKIEEE
ncbi:MAG: 1-acyl-sn-glycerol-3-phosphate acyltransferase [Clostridia bacterium]|nr:1-acyl-sn-glycerol-3-phosphate acyltransferase [Clostridia bacterium]